MTPVDEILADSRVVAARRLRESHAARARQAEGRYWFYTRMFIGATALAAISGALILYGAGAEAVGAETGAAAGAVGAETAVTPALVAVEPRGASLAVALSGTGVRTALFVLQVASLAAAAFAAEMLRETQPGADWIAERRAAEDGRTAVYDEIMGVAREIGPAAEAEAFRHFVREQLAPQVAFHAASESRHRRSAGRSAVLGGMLAAGIAATGAAGVGGPLWIAIAAFIGVVVPSLMNALRSWRESSRDQEKSELYKATWLELNALMAETGAAQVAADSGDPAPARDLVGRVHAVMRADFDTWASATGQSVTAGAGAQTGTQSGAEHE